MDDESLDGEWIKRSFDSDLPFKELCRPVSGREISRSAQAKGKGTTAPIGLDSGQISKNRVKLYKAFQEKQKKRKEA